MKCHDWKEGPYQANGSLEPGAEVFYPQKQMMNGVGAIDVAQQPSVHKDACVKCHMVPTGWGREGAGTAGNHVMAIISPQEAATQTVSETDPRNMPYSSCSTCHGKTSDPLATYLQPVFEDRQAFVEGRLTMLQSSLDAAAVKLGFADAAAAQSALTASGHAPWNVDQEAFLKAWTNRQFVLNDNSNGIHNWGYTVAVLGRAMDQADSVRDVAGLTINISSPKAANGSPYGTGKLIYGQKTSVGGIISGGVAANFISGVVQLWGSPTGTPNWMPLTTAFVYLNNEVRLPTRSTCSRPRTRCTWRSSWGTRTTAPLRRAKPLR